MVSIVFSTQAGDLDVIQLDASLSESHTSDAEVTENPVETGADIADHMRVKPKQLRIDGLVTDFPLSRPASPLFGTTPEGERGRAVRVYAQLEDLQNRRVPVEVRTSLKTYSNMVLQGLTAPRDKNTSRGSVKFSATLHEVRFVETQIVPITVTKLNAGKSEKDLGAQTTTPATDAEKKKSILLHLIDIGTGAEENPLSASSLKKRGID
jgi:hypothetical protein